MGILHQRFCPVVVINICSASHFVYFLITVLTNVSLIPTIKISIIFWTHISTAAPIFISYTEKFHAPSFFMTIFSTPICHWRNSVHGNVLDPFRHFLDCPTADISIDICFTFQLFDQFKEFMCPKMIIFSHTPPVSIDDRFSIFFWSNTVFPMVFIGKTATWPA